jgi:hypothetical protein
LTRGPAAAADKPRRRVRGTRYGVELRAPLAQVWELFDFPCGQRLAPILREQVERLRASGGLKCSQKVAGLLQEISPKTIDRLLAREREVRCLKQHRRPPVPVSVTLLNDLTGDPGAPASDSVRCRAAGWIPTDLEQVSGFEGAGWSCNGSGERKEIDSGCGPCRFTGRREYRSAGVWFRLAGSPGEDTSRPA